MTSLELTSLAASPCSRFPSPACPIWGVSLCDAASFLLFQRKCPLGSEVGYAVRFDDSCDREGKSTAVRFATDGVVLREAMGDPSLSK